jgi:hypothetical protein
MYRTLWGIALLLWLGPGDGRAQIVISDSLYSPTYNERIAYAIMLPGEYNQPANARKKYPVMYAANGSGAPYNSFSQMTPLRNYIGSHPMIVAMYDNNANGYSAFFYNEFLPFVERNWRIVPERGYRTTTGFSLGGYMCTLFAFEHPELFSSSCPMSGVFPSLDTLMQRYRDQVVMPAFYITEGLSDFLLSENREFRDSLAKTDFEYEYHENPGDHNFAYWSPNAESVAIYAWAHFVFDVLPPNAPTSLTMAGRTERTISLSWTKPAVATDGDTAVGYIIKRGGVQAGTSTTAAFTDMGLAELTSYDYQVFAVDNADSVSTTAATGSFATIGDAVKPHVSTVVSYGLTKVMVTFDESVDQTTAETAGNYLLDGGVTVSGAVLQADQRSVMVTTTTQVDNQQYNLTVQHVQDRAATVNTMDQVQVQFTARAAFQDNFESGAYAQWTPSTSAGWSVVDDMGDKSLFIAAANAVRLRVDRTYGVMSFDADLRGTGTSGYRNLSIMFGFQDTSNYYHVNFCGNNSSGSYNGIFRVKNKVETKIGTGPAALLTDTTAYHHVRVTWDGASGEIKAYFDQSYTPVFSAVDTTYRSGSCGVWSKTRQGYFDNVEVLALVRTDAFGQTGIVPQARTPEHALPAMAVYPNPARRIVIDAGRNGVHSIKVLDLWGVPVTIMAFTGRSVVWDGRNQTGRLVEPGVYCVVVDDAARSRIVITR